MPYYYFHRHLLHFREGNKIIWVALFSPVTGGRCERVSLSLFRPPPFLLEFSFLGQFWRASFFSVQFSGSVCGGKGGGERMGSHGDGNWQKLAVKFLQSRFVKGGGLLQEASYCKKASERSRSSSDVAFFVVVSNWEKKPLSLSLYFSPEEGGIHMYIVQGVLHERANG